MNNVNGAPVSAHQDPTAAAGETAAAEASSVHHRFKLGVELVQLGMFVAELDRPWIDTPFLIQGFTVDSAIELDTLKRSCTFVFIDLLRSRPESLASISTSEELNAMEEDSGPPTLPLNYEESLAAEAAAKKAPRVFRVRNDVKVSNNTRLRFRQFVKANSIAAGSSASVEEESALGRALDWLKGAFGGEAPEGRELPDAKTRAPEWIPATIRTKQYQTQKPIEQVLPQARRSITKADSAFKELQSEIKSGKQIKLAQVHEAVEDMVTAVIDNPDALMWVARLREEDVTTYNHAVRVSLYLVSLGRHLGFPKTELMNLGMIGMLADVGKTRLPRALLDKPGMLTQSEFGIIKEHVRLGLGILKKSMSLPISVELGIAQHHERLDGTGYPKGLKGDQISIYGRMTAIADCFTALISPRAYANPSPPQEALMNLYEWVGTSFHEPLVEQFVQAVGVFPVGSLVELSTGEIAVVVAHNRVRRLEPRVLVLTWPDKTPLAKPLERDLFKVKQDAQHKSIRIVRGLASGAYGLKLRDYYLEEVAKANDLVK
jgi:HD-GYP domain-containing protein (c-di-GMP phosphodiesterase class II)